MIKSCEEIIQFLREQAALRSPENDEGGCIASAAEGLEEDLRELWLDQQGL